MSQLCEKRRVMVIRDWPGSSLTNPLWRSAAVVRSSVPGGFVWLSATLMATNDHRVLMVVCEDSRVCCKGVPSLDKGTLHTRSSHHERCSLKRNLPTFQFHFHTFHFIQNCQWSYSWIVCGFLVLIGISTLLCLQRWYLSRPAVEEIFPGGLY